MPLPVIQERCDICGLGRVVTTLSQSLRIVAASPVMQELLQRVALFAESDAPVVVLGESGTGKEVIARALHANSPRHERSFIAVNVAALPADLLESELFGHVKGAFTGAGSEKTGLMEAAHQGTLFLDEIGEMPLPLQAKMLRALQDGEIRRVGDTRSFAVDVRLVCATHRDLAAQVRAGGFREDLYYRLKVLTLEVPPLRARPEDIAHLAEYLLAGQRRSGATLSRAALARLEAHDWPGNVRELANVLEHGAALARGGEIRLEHLPRDLGAGARRDHDHDRERERDRPSAARRPSPALPLAPRDHLATLAEIERDYIEYVLERCGGSQTEAARVLGIGRNTLWRKLREASGSARTGGRRRGRAARRG